MATLNKVYMVEDNTFGCQINKEQGLFTVPFIDISSGVINVEASILNYLHLTKDASITFKIFPDSNGEFLNIKPPIRMTKDMIEEALGYPIEIISKKLGPELKF
jgi:hypothetical protein